MMRLCYYQFNYIDNIMKKFMIQLAEHNQNLKNYFHSFSNGQNIGDLEQYVCLDQIDQVLRNILSLKDMREIGSFFTGDELATEVVNAFSSPVSDESFILDPTCGAGNLLIACSRNLIIHEYLSDTLKHWGNILFGYDLYPEFVETTKLRLILEAIKRGCLVDCPIDTALEMLKGIRSVDAMSVIKVDVANITHVVMNPPFSMWESPKRDYWKQGKVNAAALVFDHFLRILPDNCRICAVLPEVLRSGTRYECWREYVSRTISTAHVKIIGRFNSKTDVDVFTLSGDVNKSEVGIDWVTTPIHRYNKISDQFDVSVGRLVAYRDPEEGKEYPYIHSRNTPAWQIIRHIDERRKFLGAVILPPFVVIKRTSSPNDRYRASGAVIGGKEPVAVENHLIVIKPKKATIYECKKLLKVLQSSQTNSFLNSRIRCRHLTVGAVKEIPYFSEANSK